MKSSWPPRAAAESGVCGRYTLAGVDPQALGARFGLQESLRIERRFNIAPGDRVPAVVCDREGARRGALLRWGLVPAWADSPRSGPGLINARAETAASKPAFRGALRRFRCLILADGFYEWRRDGTSDRRAFWITRSDGEPFAFAGLWSPPRPSGGQPELGSFAILTTAANSAIARLHERMPVILDRDAEPAWLDLATPPERLPALLGGLAAAQTELRAVGPAVNDARYDGPRCLEAAAEPQPTLF